MKTLSIFVVALAIGTALGASFQSRSLTAVPMSRGSSAAIVDGASNAAFRDGLYQAKLAVERGSGVHIAAGRWASDDDRVSFAAGYQQGYMQALNLKHGGGKAVRG